MSRLRRRPRALRSVVLVALGLVSAAAVPAGTAFAHASQVESSLVDGAVLDTAPREVTITFDEEVMVPEGGVTLVHVADGTTESLDAVVEGTEVSVTLPELEDAPYLLRYGVVDPADLHRTVGSISFGVGVAAPPSADEDQLTVSPWASWSRGVADLGLLLGVGLAVVLLAVPLDLRARRRAVTWSTCAGVLTVAAWAAVLAFETASVGWRAVSWSSVLLGSDPGRRVVIGLQLVLGLGWMARTVTSRATHPDEQVLDRTLSSIAATFWGGLVLLAALGGHAGVGGPWAIGVALRWAHLVALGAWLGTLAVVTMLQRGTSWRAPWRVVATCGAAGLAATGVTGLLLSGRSVETITAMLSTRTGALVVLKGAGLAAIALVGLASARTVAAGRTPRGRVLAVEAVLAIVVVMFGAFLAGSSPAVGERFRPLPAEDPQVRTTDVEDLVVTASVRPAHPGDNLVGVAVLETRRPSPGASTGVVVSLSDETGRTVSSATVDLVDGRADVAGLRIPSPGTWRLSVQVDRPSAPLGAAVSTIDVAPVPAVRAETVVSDGRWSPWASLAALGWALLVWCAHRLLRRRSVRLARAVSAAAAAESVDLDPAVLGAEELLELEAHRAGEPAIGDEQHELVSAG